MSKTVGTLCECSVRMGDHVASNLHFDKATLEAGSALFVVVVLADAQFVLDERMVKCVGGEKRKAVAIGNFLIEAGFFKRCRAQIGVVLLVGIRSCAKSRRMASLPPLLRHP